MTRKIALRLLMYFALALAAFALASGLLFQAMFTRQVFAAKETEMTQRAAALAQALSQALEESGAGKATGNQGMGGYGAFVRMLSLLETNAWVLDANLQLLSAGHRMGQTLDYAELPADAEALVRAVFAGQSPKSEGFSALLGTPTLTVGAPIYQGGQVAGALLLHDAVSGMEAASSQGFTVLLYSGLIALPLSILLAVLLSYNFTRPISRMKYTALRLADGEYHAKTAVTRKDELGELAHTLDTLGDRLLEARSAGERQEQLRKDFLTTVSHELRTPVTALRGSLEALCDGVVTDPAQVTAYQRQMLGETQGIQRLVNDLLEMSKLQNPAFVMESASLILQDVLEDALHTAQRMAQAKKVAVRPVFPAQPVPFRGDYGRLRQMFLIVLDNAVKFSPPHSTVTVTLEAGSVTIRDQGCGIPPDDLPLIFTRFHRAGTAENAQGSGLGLAIAKEVAQRHGMQIAVESEVGRGSAFRFGWLEQP